MICPQIIHHSILGEVCGVAACITVCHSVFLNNTTGGHQSQSFSNSTLLASNDKTGNVIQFS